MVRYARRASCSIRTEHRMVVCTISSRYKGARMRRAASSRSLILPLRSPRTTSFSVYRRGHMATNWWRAFPTYLSKTLSRPRRNRTGRWAPVISTSAATPGISRDSDGRHRTPPADVRRRSLQRRRGRHQRPIPQRAQLKCLAAVLTRSLAGRHGSYIGRRR
jgi:hypothetical protein